MSIVAWKSAAQELASILASGLEFHDASSSYASHSLHAFAAKFPPQLPRLFIEHLTGEGEIVLDPMVGSGTTIVEAYLRRRRGIGVDIDPLALHICRVKTTHIDLVVATDAGERAITTANQLLQGEATLGRFLERLPEDNRQFIDYWFAERTQRELAALLLSIEREQDDKVRDFLHLVFSSIIMTKSGGVSLARDLAHSRPHRDKTKVPRNAIEQFRQKLLKSARALEELRLHYNGIEVRQGDCRHLQLDDNSVHLVVTSPPYANAIDYMRAHKFSLVWLGLSLSFLSRLRSTYIGAEKIGDLPDLPLPRKTETIIGLLAAKDFKKAMILRKYFLDMRASISEMSRVLQPGRSAIIVVGPSTMRGLRIDTPLCLGEIAEELGFHVVGIKERKLDRNRRMMPARFQNNGQSVIEQRMHEESAIGLLKL